MMWRAGRFWASFSHRQRGDPIGRAAFQQSHDDSADDVQITQRRILSFWKAGASVAMPKCIETVAQNDWEIEHDGDAI